MIRITSEHFQPQYQLVVMGREIKGSSIFQRSDNRGDFLTRLEILCEGEPLSGRCLGAPRRPFPLPHSNGKIEDICYRILCLFSGHRKCFEMIFIYLIGIHDFSQ